MSTGQCLARVEIQSCDITRVQPSIGTQLCPPANTDFTEKEINASVLQFLCTSELCVLALLQASVSSSIKGEW